MIRESSMEGSFYINQYENHEEDTAGYEFNEREAQEHAEYTADAVEVRGKTPNGHGGAYTNKPVSRQNYRQFLKVNDFIIKYSKA